jgi:iron complex transport system ATP-binding protein
MALEVTSLDVSYGPRKVLNGVSINSFEPGRTVGVIGPNAAGKSTLFRSIAGLLTSDGTVRLNGQDASELASGERSKRVFYMPQNFSMDAVLTVFEVVLLALKQSGRSRVSEEDIGDVGAALDRLDIAHLADRMVSELSGGQQQMVSIAQALVRAPEVMLLDEPTSALDLRHQIEVLQRVRLATRERGSVSLVALHDLNLAARFSDRLILMGQGAVIADGYPEEVLSSPLIEETYGVRVETGRTASGQLYVAPLDTNLTVVAAQ